MKCVKCGAQINSVSRFCSNCGAENPVDSSQNVISEEDHAVAPNMPAGDSRPTATMSERDFYREFATKNGKSWVTALSVICFLSAGISIILFISSNLFSLIDIVFYITMGVLLLTKKKWGIALAITIYGGCAMLLNLLSGNVTGIVALLAGIFATVELKRINTAFAEYQKTGELPPKQVQVAGKSMKKP